MLGGFLMTALLTASAVLTLWILRSERKDVQAGRARVNRGTGHALLGLQEFIQPSVEFVFQAENTEDKVEEDGLQMGAEEAIRIGLAESLARTRVDHEEVRWHLNAALREGLDWQSLYEAAVEAELRSRPYRAPALPPHWRVQPRQ
jgi:hypothetical protein